MSEIQRQSLTHFIQSLDQNPSTLPIHKKMHEGHFQSLIVSFLCWHSLSGYGRLTKQELTTIITSCETWHAGVVTVLSKLARSLKVKQFNNELPQETKKICEFAFNAELDILGKHISTKHKQIKNRNKKQMLNDSCQNIAKFIVISNFRFDHKEKSEALTLLDYCFGSDQHILTEQTFNDCLHQAKIKVTSSEQLTLADL